MIAKPLIAVRLMIFSSIIVVLSQGLSGSTELDDGIIVNTPIASDIIRLRQADVQKLANLK